MLKATLKKGAIVPLEPLPPEWPDGAALEIELAEAPAIEIDAWAKMMNELCEDSNDDDESVMQEAIDQHREQAKEQVRRQMGLSA
jgi:hypothetical protein